MVAREERERGEGETDRQTDRGRKGRGGGIKSNHITLGTELIK